MLPRALSLSLWTDLCINYVFADWQQGQTQHWKRFGERRCFIFGLFVTWCSSSYALSFFLSYLFISAGCQQGRKQNKRFFTPPSSCCWRLETKVRDLYFFLSLSMSWPDVPSRNNKLICIDCIAEACQHGHIQHKRGEWWRGREAKKQKSWRWM